MEFFRNITAPELGVSPIGLDVQSVPNLSTPSLSDLVVKQPLINAYDLGNKIPLFPPPSTGSGSGSGSGSGTDVVPDVNSDNTGSTDVFTPVPTGSEKTTEQANYYYYPQGSTTPVYTSQTPSVTPVIIDKEYVGLSKTTKTLLTIGGIVAALFVLGVFKNSNVIK